MKEERDERICAKTDLARQLDANRIGRITPGTVETIRSELADDIAHALCHPTIYVGDDARGAFALDIMLWTLCRLWARLGNQQSQFRDLESNKIGELDSVEAVVQRWRSFAKQIQIPLYDDST